MSSLTEKAESILKDPHFFHAAGLGLGSLLLVKYLAKTTPAGPAPPVVQLAAKPRNTQLLVGVGVAALAYLYMTKYGHGLPAR